jgi:hypothetical protein
MPEGNAMRMVGSWVSGIEKRAARPVFIDVLVERGAGKQVAARRRQPSRLCYAALGSIP